MPAVPFRLCCGLAALAAAPAAAQSYACSFEADAGGAMIEARLEPAGTGWRFGALDEEFPAVEIALPEASARHFVVAPVDAPAEAVALLSVFASGAALLTTHGDFLEPAAVTRAGTCAGESN